MIIIIGKEDRAKMQDISAYLNQCSDYILADKPFFGKQENNKRVADDCKNLSCRILKALGILKMSK